jgi:hypothetical protein
LIDLLYRSNFISESDTLELSEYKYDLKLVFKNINYNKKYLSIRVSIFRALLHYLGIQQYLKILRILDKFIPVVFEQRFYYIKKIMCFKIENNKLIDKNNNEKVVFGKSIHYSNLKINGIHINDFLRKISPKVIGLGMAYVEQGIPGPISNDILKDLMRKKIN